MTICARENCGHDRVMHPHAGACRMCSCEAFMTPGPEPEVLEDHAHRWQPAGVIGDLVAPAVVGLCPCGAVVRIRVPAEATNA